MHGMKWPKDYINQVICGDCLEVMKSMPDECVNMVWTDPPYNAGKDYGTYKDKLSDNEYLKMCEMWAREMKRVSGNRMAIFVPQKYKLDWWLLLGSDYREIILTWSPEGSLRGGFCNQFSTLLTNMRPLKYTKNVWHNCQMPGLGYFFRENNYNHPGYTSEDITARVIMAFSELGQKILDPFGGAGTTAAVCKVLGRNSVSVEVDAGWCEMARKRIAQAAEQQDLFRNPVQERQAEQHKLGLA
ncbi:MAG: site-specific DNA-methyltransferase [Bacteroidales bacterium]|nr:site-specific DNA-methyltransferase [Candidatus Latescibacterota bacterium]